MADSALGAERELHPAPVAVRRIDAGDLRAAVAAGIDDFLATPTQLLFLGLIYPIVGVLAARVARRADLLPLLYPLVAGLALTGPVAAVGIYELSRRRERGLPVSWLNAFDVLRSPALFSIACIGVLLLAIFVGWLAAAQAIYVLTFGGAAPETLAGFLGEVFTTAHGWALIILGNAVGLLLAALVLTLTVVSIPMLLDRDVGPVTAMRTSVRAVLANPVTMAQWGLFVIAALLVGSIPYFVGLAVVMPILGHATWHLYRRTVA